MKNKQKKALYISVGLLLVVAIVASVAGVWAKYAQNYEFQSKINKTTVFTSDYLKTADTSYPTYTVYDTSITFVIRNFDGTKTSDISFNYTVTASDGTLDETGATKRFSANATQTDTYELTASTGQSVTVTAQTADGTQTIGAVFAFAGTPTKYSIKDNGNFITLTLDIGTNVKNIKITYGANLNPDNSHPLMRKWSSETEETLSSVKSDSTPYIIEQNTHYELVFFKVDANITYDEESDEDFIGNTIAIDVAPVMP